MLADDSTQVAQQNEEKTIQRARSDWRITGKYPNSSSYPRRIFFELGRWNVDTEETAKLDTLTATSGFNATALTLKGLASEEGSAAVNLRIARNRIREVDRKLRRKGHSAPRTPQQEPTAGLGRIDYRLMRSVEIIPAGTTSTVPSARAIVPCSTVTNYPGHFTDAIDEAKRLIGDGRTAVGRSSRSTTTNNLLTQFFGSATGARATEVHNRLDALHTHVDNMRNASAHQCINVCTNTLASNQGHGSSAMMTLCPQFFNSGLNERATTLIHEGVHGTDAIQGTDHAYAHHRLITFLDPAQSIENPDSYVLFLQSLDGQSPQVGRPHPDIVGGMNSTEEGQARKIVAWLEKWLTTTYLQIATMYRRLDALRTAGGTWPVGFYSDIMGFTAARFGLTAPPAVDTASRDDQIKVAAIHDRYRTMRNVFWQQLNITKSSRTTWQRGPRSNVTVGADFFSLSSSPVDQLNLLLRKLVHATPNISSSLEPHYVELVNEIRTRAGVLAPPP